MNELEKFKDLKYVEALAKQKSQKTKEDQIIYKTKISGFEVYKITEASNPVCGIVKTIRYTKPVVSREVLQNNGNKQLEPVKKKKKSKGKLPTIK
ncbi:MAG: hypothetical protein WC933_03550 [Candidatus Paceibacterota bacterium]|jgi:hypothetical protein